MAIRGGELTDEVWARLDAGADRLPRRQTLLVALAGLLVAVLTAGSVIAWHAMTTSGLRLVTWSMTGTSAGRSGTGAWEYTYTLQIANEGGEVAVAAMGRDFPGLTLVAAKPMAITEVDSVTGYHVLPWPVILSSGETARFDLVYRAAGCAVGPAQADIPVTLNRWWGSQRQRVDVDSGADWALTVPHPGCAG